MKAKANMSSKMRIKMGDIEIDFEGSEEFLKDELPEVLKAVTALHDRVPAKKKFEPTEESAKSSSSGITTQTIAARMNCKTAPDLIRAAALGLTANGSKTFSRKALLDEMLGEQLLQDLVLFEPRVLLEGSPQGGHTEGGRFGKIFNRPRSIQCAQAPSSVRVPTDATE